MPNDFKMSFTATLLINGHPVRAMDEFTDLPVTVGAHAGNPTVDVSQALGVLMGPDAEWDSERDSGLIDFHLLDTAPCSACLLYFRHQQGKYRVYVRTGAYAGFGWYTCADQVPRLQQGISVPPPLWTLRHAYSDQVLTLDKMPTGRTPICLEPPGAQRSISLEGIGDRHNGGYLKVAGAGSRTRLSLNIVEREADWLA
ncbi:hypothetical protein [Pseudomonas sp. KNUC1026]|uniref:hypothetical protein n=1 Tax=Pseudomonas sp. KNUC1026 TaxID=2893890 RepID=UPI001F262BEF|nr:hypothetical protein [Pseudomonas sp. KNUC1026]UFH48823.1 hypothetical protein LN139_17840 [Pseudomonas sp. KNUC1026]